MSTLNDLSAVKVDRRSFELDGHVAYGVRDRITGRLIGHVGKTRNKIYGCRNGTWCYLHVAEPRDVNGAWTLAGWTRADAIDHLMSADHPSGMFVSGV